MLPGYTLESSLVTLGFPEVRLRYILAFLLIFYVFLYLYQRRMSPFHLAFINKILNTFIIILTCTCLITGIHNYTSEKRHELALKQRDIVIKSNVSKKDIIWILADEYASPHALLKYFQFKDPLVDTLKKKGFFVFDNISSRSDVTIFSINSLFNLDDSLPLPNFMYAAQYLRISLWIKFLKQQGYQFTNLDFLNIGDQQHFLKLRIFPETYLDQILANTLLIRLWNSIIQNNKRPNDEYNFEVMKALHEKLTLSPTSPNFMWAHLMIPHTPFYRDSSGSLNANPISDLDHAHSNEIIHQYTSYLSYGNKKIIGILDSIPNWKNKIIIISGDHGARMLLKENDPERRSTFAAIYYSGMQDSELNTIKYIQQIPLHLH